MRPFKDRSSPAPAKGVVYRGLCFPYEFLDTTAAGKVEQLRKGSSLYFDSSVAQATSA